MKKNKTKIFILKNLLRFKNNFSSYNLYYKNFYFILKMKKNIINYDLIYSIRTRKKKLLLLKISFKKSKLMVNHVEPTAFNNKNNHIRFLCYFVNKSIIYKNSSSIILIKIRKTQRIHRRWKYFKQIDLSYMVFRELYDLSWIFYFLNKKCKILFLHNKTHSKRTTKLKKRRRK